jgi:phospholipid transport system substrate-binding protein
MTRGPRAHELARCFAIFLGLLVTVASAAVFADKPLPSTPQATIRTITAEALAALRESKAATSKDPAGVAARIAGIVDPYLDFTIMSEEVLGLGWRRADAQQRARFMQVFKQLLTDDSAAVFKQYTGQTIKVTDSRWDDAVRDRATVSSRIDSPGAEPVRVDYRMFHAGGRWRVYDVVVEGVSLLVNYREVFASELQQESLDGLITQLEQKVAALRSSAAQ